MIEQNKYGPFPPLDISYLVVAGGGSAQGGGGGGAGGYRNSYASESSGANSSTETPLSLSTSTNYLSQLVEVVLEYWWWKSN